MQGLISECVCYTWFKWLRVDLPVLMLRKIWFEFLGAEFLNYIAVDLASQNLKAARIVDSQKNYIINGLYTWPNPEGLALQEYAAAQAGPAQYP